MVLSGVSHFAFGPKDLKSIMGLGFSNHLLYRASFRRLQW